MYLSVAGVCCCVQLLDYYAIHMSHCSDYNAMWAGRGQGMMKDLFKQARKHKKAVIFIDEVSASTYTALHTLQRTLTAPGVPMQCYG
jgi:ATPase family associated with various cellular activities (AAA)